MSYLIAANVPVSRVASGTILVLISHESHRVQLQETYEGAVGALVPLLVAGVAGFVKVAGTLRFGEEDFVVLGKGVANAEGTAADLRILSVGDADGDVVHVSEGAGTELC